MHLYTLPDLDRIEFKGYYGTSDPDSPQHRETRILHTAFYLCLFRFRHPLAYFLWYRHRVLLALPKADRNEIYAQMRGQALSSWSPNARSTMTMMNRDDEFALWHPFLFLFVDAFFGIQKLISAISHRFFRPKQ